MVRLMAGGCRLYMPLPSALLMIANAWQEFRDGSLTPGALSCSQQAAIVTAAQRIHAAVRTVHELIGELAASLGEQERLLRVTSHLQLLQADLLLPALISDQKAVGLHTAGVVLHVQSYRSPRLRASSNVVELEAH